jgi:hypothetical protein
MTLESLMLDVSKLIVMLQLNYQCRSLIMLQPGLMTAWLFVAVKPQEMYLMTNAGCLTGNCTVNQGVRNSKKNRLKILPVLTREPYTKV